MKIYIRFLKSSVLTPNNLENYKNNVTYSVFSMKNLLNISLILILIVFSLTKTESAIQEALGENSRWLVEFNSNDVGLVNTIFTFETEDNKFIAYTREGASGELFGFWKSTLARMFTNSFENGSLMRITDGIITVDGESYNLKGIFKSAIGNYYFNGKINGGLLKGELTDSKNAVRGTINGSKTKITTPLNNYQEIISETFEVTKQNIYSRKNTESNEWLDFEEDMKDVSYKISDDIELVFAFYNNAGKLPFSHLSLIRIKPESDENKSQPQQVFNNVLLIEKSENTAYMEIKSFGGSAEEMDSVMNIVTSKNYKNLIVDLRNNPGGSVVAGLTFAKNVIDTTLVSGIFLTQKWFAKNNYIPDINEYNRFPYFKDADFSLFIEGIHNQEGLVLQAVPNKEVFKGKIYILTNKNTASTCEPIVYGLKKSKRAVIVGETTAGAMLTGEKFLLKSGFTLTVPTADYYTSDKYRIDRNGVKPDIEVKSSESFNYVMDNFINK